VNIIIVSDTMAKPRVLTLRQVILFQALLIAGIGLMLSLFILPQADGKHHGVKALIPAALHLVSPHTQEHIDALAMQLGELQARMMRLDATSERLSGMAGISPSATQDAQPEAEPGRGGPEVRAYGLDAGQLQDKISELLFEMERKQDQLSAIEAFMMQQTLQKNAFPNGHPVNSAYNSSSYGWRLDPFSGRMAFHEGLDFTAVVGTPIYAAAGGIVTTAEQTPDYGKIVKIDHGAGFETRYAHASELLVKVGERVEKGQMIAKVGTTGRSTGAHLHFEVRLNGAPLDPRKYLLN
jgi:murein DD-endopeptidase MepM/ murein hydrolase activator NlpD